MMSWPAHRRHGEEAWSGVFAEWHEHSDACIDISRIFRTAVFLCGRRPIKSLSTMAGQAMSCGGVRCEACHIVNDIIKRPDMRNDTSKPATSALNSEHQFDAARKGKSAEEEHAKSTNDVDSAPTLPVDYAKNADGPPDSVATTPQPDYSMHSYFSQPAAAISNSKPCGDDDDDDDSGQEKSSSTINPTSLKTPTSSAAEPSASTAPSPPSPMLKKVQSRVALLVGRHSQPLNACTLPGLYEKVFREKLDFKGLGYTKMRRFLETIPSIELQFATKGPPLFLMLRENCTVADTLEMSPERHNDNGDSTSIAPSTIISENKPRGVDGNSCQVDSRGQHMAGPKPTRPQAVAAKRELIIERIELLVGRHSPLDSGRLPLLYKEEFNESLDYKALGYDKMKPLLETMPSIELRTSSKGPPLILMMREKWTTSDGGQSKIAMKTHEPARTTVSVAETRARVKCLVSSNAPVDMCDLPRLYQEAYSDGLDYKALGFNKLKEFLATIPSIRIQTSEESLVSLLYMSEAHSDERLNSGHDAPETSKSVSEFEENQEAVVTDDEMRYGCTECGELQDSWGRCLDHLKVCCPELLDNRKGLQQRCMLKHKMCEVPKSRDTMSQSEMPKAFASYYDWARVKANEDDNHPDTTRSHSTDEESTEHSIDGGLAGDDLVKKCIKDLVACHSPLDVANLPKLYQDAFNEKLNIGTRTSLKDFLTGIPLVAVGISEDMSTHIAYSTVQLTGEKS